MDSSSRRSLLICFRVPVPGKWVKLFSVLFILFPFLFLFAPLGEGANYDVSVSSSRSSKTVSPGDFVTLAFRIENRGTQADTYSFSVDLPQGWPLMGEPGSLNLNPGGKESIFVTFQVPSVAEAKEYNVSLRAESAGQPGLVASGRVEVSVEEVGGVTIEKPTDKSVKPGEKASYSFKIKNTGNFQDSFQIEASSGHDWLEKVPEEKIDLMPGSSASFNLTVAVPADAEAGRDFLRVKLSSVVNKAVEDRVIVYTRVLPPSPRAVGGKLYEILDGRFRGGFSTDLMGERSNDFQFDLDAGGPDEFATLLVSGDVGGGDDELSFGDTNIGYRQGAYTIEGGSVGRSFTPLLSSSGSGLALTAEWERYELDLLDAAGGGENISGARGRLNYDPLTFDLSFTHELDPAGPNVSVESVRARFQPQSEWYLQVEGASSQENGEAAGGLLIGGSARYPNWGVSGEFFSLAPDFSGARSDERGISLSQRYSSERWGERLFLDFRHENLGDGSGEPTVRYQDIGGDFLFKTEEEVVPDLGLGIRLFGEKELKKNPEVDFFSTTLETTLRGTFEDINYSLQGTWDRDYDFINGTSFQSFTFRESLNAYYERYAWNISLTQDFTENLTSGAVISSTSTIKGGVSIYPSERNEIALSFSKSGEDLTFDGSGSVVLSDTLTFEVSAGLGIPDGDLSLGLSVECDYDFELPLPYAVTKGRLEGNVFVDGNRNGKKDSGEEGVEGLVMVLDQTKVSSGEEGYYRFPPLKPGDYDFNIENLPQQFVLTERYPSVKIEKGKTTSVPIPLARVSLIQGVVYEDGNRNGQRDAGEEGLPGVRLTLAGDELNEAKETVSDNDGEFRFLDLLPGNYVLSASEKTLSARTTFTTEKELSVDLKPGESFQANFGTYQEPRKIIFGQPPRADFEFQPPRPEPQKEAFFDGRISEDPDGEIVKYEWDFDGDGEAEAKGKRAFHAFPEVGTFSVTLTVVDGDGNSDSVTKKVEVGKKVSFLGNSSRHVL